MANIDHEELQIEMNSLLEQVKSTMPDESCCIYRVPNDIRGINEDCFTPKVVSIGPFHYRRHPRLQKMQEYKSLFHEQFCERISSTVSSDALISFVEEIEPIVRRYYSEPIELSNKELVKVILLDSCFIFELFWRSYYIDWKGVINFKPWQANTIRLDFLLLENQLPFPELESLFTRIFPSSKTNNSQNNPSFLMLTSDYFKYYNKKKLYPQGVSISHFIDLIRTFYLPPRSSRSRRPPKSARHLQSATELAEAGLTFRKGTSPSLLEFRLSPSFLGFKLRPILLRFKFLGRVLEIPELRVDDSTETLFRNLVALEECHYPSDSYITDYVAIMDFLINTSNDVDLLVREGIIINWLGESKSVAYLFKSLRKNVINFNTYYAETFNDLNAFCKSPWNKLKATLRRDYCNTLRHDYCNTPWKIVATISGILLLVLTLIQAVCSVLQVLPQYKNSSSH